MGYLKLSAEGVILIANLKIASSLGVQPHEMVHVNLSRFITPNSQDQFYLHRQSLAEQDSCTCELEMSCSGGRLRNFRLESVAIRPAGVLQFLTVLIDITEESAAKRALQLLNVNLSNSLSDRTDSLEGSVAYIRLLNQAITNLSEGVMITDSDLNEPGPNILFVNDAVCRMTGYSPDELIGKPSHTLVGSRTDLPVRQQILRELSAGRSCQRELSNSRKDGSTFECELFVGPMRDSLGSITNFISISRDITSSKAEQAERAQLAAIVQTSNDAIFSMDLTGKISSWNDAASRTYGYSKDEILGNSIARLFHEDNRGEFSGILARIQCGERIASFETVHVDNQCRQIDVAMTVSTMVNSQGDSIGASAIVSDISNRKKMERLLKFSEERLRAILNTASDAIIMIDLRGNVQSFNQAAEVMFGYSSEEIIGQNVKILMPSPFREEHDDYLQRFLETGIKRVIGGGREVVGRRKDGSIFPIDLAVSEVDHLQLYTGVLRDISKRKQLEREVIEIASLEQQRIGQDLHDSIGQQLTGMIMLASVLADSLQSLNVEVPPSDGQSKTLSQLTSQAGRLATGLEHVLEDIRAICRAMAPVPIDGDGLPSALQKLVDDVRGQSLIHCTFTCPVSVEEIDSVTAMHLFNIAQGALSNALRHSKAQHIQVRLEQNSSELTLSIRDDGVGFSDIRHLSIGIRIMQNRAQIIGGMLAIRPVLPAGTEVLCIVPLGHENLARTNMAK